MYSTVLGLGSRCSEFRVCGYIGSCRTLSRNEKSL